MINKEDLIKPLGKFGLDTNDSRLYLGLLQMGSVTVGSLSSKLEIDRGKAYRSLNHLRNLGLVSTTFSNPTICSAVAPEEALKSVIEKNQDEVITMQKLTKKIINDLKFVTKEKDSVVESSFSIIQGRSNIYARIGKLIQQATNQVYILTPVEDTLRMYHTSIPEKITLCRKNGIEVRLLTFTKSENLLPLVDRLTATETRIGELPSKSRVIVEKQRQLIMSGNIKETMDLNEESDSILYTNATEMVNNMYSLCEHLWKRAKPIKLFLKK